MSQRQTAKEIFLGTLERLRIEAVIGRRVRCVEGTLRVGDLEYPLREFRRVVVIAIGKAATSMCEAILPIVRPALGPEQSIEAVVVGSTAPAHADPQVRFFEGSHPYPDARSHAAAEAILRVLGTCDERCLVLFLISGGSSAMVEMALDAAMSEEAVAGFHGALVRSGLPITQMNALRKHFSAVKGGRLAVAGGRAAQCTLLISDVPEGALDVVGSGPSLPDRSTVEECRAILGSDLGADAVRFGMPEEVVAYFSSTELPETPKWDHPAFRRAAWMPLLSSEDLCREAAGLATAAGFHVVVDNTCDEWDYRDAAEYLLQRVTELHGEYGKVCLLSAGEVSVKLPREHGAGGRNQHFALESARRIAEGGLPVTVLSGGSDGIDGTSRAAGAVCDETTSERAERLGFDVGAALERFDSGPLLEAVGDVLVTGPTGNNVRDLRIFLVGG